MIIYLVLRMLSTIYEPSAPKSNLNTKDWVILKVERATVAQKTVPMFGHFENIDLP